MYISVTQCHSSLIHPKGSTKKDHYSITGKVLPVPGTQGWCKLTSPKVQAKLGDCSFAGAFTGSCNVREEHGSSQNSLFSGYAT